MMLPPKIRQRIRAYGLTLFLLGLTLILLATLFTEGLLVSKNLAESRSSPSSAGEPVETTIALSEHALPAIGSYSETIGRPLFMESRRPSPPAAAEPAPKREPPAPVSFKLMGIIATPKGPVALIADKKGKYHRLRPKEQSEGWEVNEIRADRLIVEQDGIKEDVSLIKKRPKTAHGPGDSAGQDPDPRATPPQPNHPSPVPAPPAISQPQIPPGQGNEPMEGEVAPDDESMMGAVY